MRRAHGEGHGGRDAVDLPKHLASSLDLQAVHLVQGPLEDLQTPLHQAGMQAGLVQQVCVFDKAPYGQAALPQAALWSCIGWEFSRSAADCR